MWDISVHATYIELRALGTYTTYDYGPWFKIGLSTIIQPVPAARKTNSSSSGALLKTAGHALSGGVNRGGVDSTEFMAEVSTAYQAPSRSGRRTPRHEGRICGAS